MSKIVKPKEANKLVPSDPPKPQYFNKGFSTGFQGILGWIIIALILIPIGIAIAAENVISYVGRLFGK